MGPPRVHKEVSPYKHTVSKDHRMENGTDDREVAMKQYTNENLKKAEDTSRAIVNKCGTAEYHG